MPRFSIRNPYFIVVVCLALAVIGINALSRMPVDLFPPINLRCDLLQPHAARRHQPANYPTTHRSPGTMVWAPTLAFASLTVICFQGGGQGRNTVTVDSMLAAE